MEAQPKKSHRQRRPQILTRNLKVRFSDDEFSRLQEIATGTGVSIGEIVRRSCATTKSITIEDRQGLRELQGEVARIGNNLNQIARWCNTHPKSAASFEMLQVLQKIEKHLGSIK